MSIHATTQICGPDSDVRAYRINGSELIFITVTDGRSSVTLNPVTLRQMNEALASFQADELANGIEAA